MVFKPTNPKPPQAGYTLVEMLVGTALGTLLLIGVASLYLFGAKSFASMINYVELNGQNRHANDILSRDIRSATAVRSATRTNMVLRLPKGDVTYAFDETAGKLTRSLSGEEEVMLSGLVALGFSLYERPVLGAGYEQFPAATAATAKLVGFEWTTSRRVYGTQKSSENVETALVELRNQ